VVTSITEFLPLVLLLSSPMICETTVHAYLYRLIIFLSINAKHLLIGLLKKLENYQIVVAREAPCIRLGLDFNVKRSGKTFLCGQDAFCGVLLFVVASTSVLNILFWKEGSLLVVMINYGERGTCG